MLAWGYNFDGELGNGAMSLTGCECSAVPVPVSLPSGSRITAVAAAIFHALAVTSTGSVLAWGYNINGQLGDGTTSDSDVPVPVSLPSGISVTSVAGGQDYSLALTSTGSLLAWGYNGYGALGNGTTSNSYVPIPVSLPSGTTIAAVAAGWETSLALTS